MSKNSLSPAGRGGKNEQEFLLPGGERGRLPLPGGGTKMSKNSLSPAGRG